MRKVNKKVKSWILKIGKLFGGGYTAPRKAESQFKTPPFVLFGFLGSNQRFLVVSLHNNHYK